MRGAVTLRVPELAQRGVVGSGCCAVPAAPAIERDLLGWAGVSSVEVDVSSGLVRVVVDGDRPRAEELAWSLRMLGFTDVLATTADDGA